MTNRKLKEGKKVYVLKRTDNDENFGIFSKYEFAAEVLEKYENPPYMIIEDVELDKQCCF
jgi:hypothetical protein